MCHDYHLALQNGQTSCEELQWLYSASGAFLSCSCYQIRTLSTECHQSSVARKKTPPQPCERLNYLKIQRKYGRDGENSFASRPTSSVSSDTRRNPSFFIAWKNRPSTQPLHAAMASRPTWRCQSANRNGFRSTRNPCLMIKVQRGVEVQACAFSINQLQQKSVCVF